MKRWEQPIVRLTYVPRAAEILAHATLWIGNRLNLTRGYPVRVFSRDPTPVADAILQAHASQHGA